MTTKYFFLLTTLLAFLGTGLSTTAQAQTTEQALITTSITADVSADKVWMVLRQLDNIPALTSTVGSITWKGPKGVGGERRCETPDGSGYFIEKILAFDDVARSYQWHVAEGVPAKNVINSFRVVDLGYNKSMIVFRSNFEFMENPNMTEAQFTAFLQGASKEMAGNVVALARK